MDEIAELIQKISGSANTFYWGPDHGFIYKRNPNTGDKIYSGRTGQIKEAQIYCGKSR